MSSKKRKPIWRKILGGIAYVAFLVLFFLSGSLFGWIKRSPTLEAMVKNHARDAFGMEKIDPFKDRDSITLLILGCDQELYYGGKQVLKEKARSDMMLVAKLDFKNNRITGLSIPRDTLASPPGWREQKINAFHVLGGPELSRLAVESLLPGVSIDKTMALNYKAFREMIDLVGGVEVYVPKNMNYDDNAGNLHIHLKAGKQHLDGEQAEGFVRFRHSDDDFKRTERQRDFLLALKGAVQGEISKLPEVIEKGRGVLDNALSPEEVASLADFARKVGADNIKMGMVPVVDANNGRYDLRVDQSQLASTMRKFHFAPGEEDLQSRVSSR